MNDNGERERLNERKEIVADLRRYWPDDVEVRCAADLLEADAAELAACQAVIESAKDVNEWLCRNGLKGTAHQQHLDEKLAALASPLKEAKECTIVHSEDPSAPAYLALGAVKVTRERCG